MEDSESLNGRVFNNSILPDDIIMKILEYVPGSEILNARLVCKNWDYFAVETVRHLYRKRHSRSPDDLPLRYLIIRLYRNVFDRNLLRNVNGELGFKHWKMLWNGGDKFKVEPAPQGAPPLPSEVPEFSGLSSCFATSYRACEKCQAVAVPAGGDLDYALGGRRARVYASEWVCPRFDCGAEYRMKVVVRGRDGRIQQAIREVVEEQWSDNAWKKVEVEIDCYPENVKRIEFSHFGKDTQFWAGHYGMKMAGAVVKLLPID